MALDITGIGAVAESATKILGMIFPDKTEEEKAKIAASLALITGQMDIDKAEAQSTDPLQHWRGGLGWVCTFAYAWQFVLRPMTEAACVIAGHPVSLPVLDFAPLATLTAAMLGLGGLHVYQQVKGS